MFIMTACMQAQSPNTRNLMGYTAQFNHPDATTGNPAILSVKITKANEPVTGLEMQGQIMDATQKDIHYEQPTESNGVYSFAWTPYEPGKYYAQFIFRTENEIIKPTYLFTVQGTSMQCDDCPTAVHWHSQLNMNICGTPYHLPLEAGDLNKQHTHNATDKLHLHAMVKSPNDEELELGNLFEQLNIKFNATCFADHCNGDLCPDGKPGALTMRVSNQSNQDFDNYLWRDGDIVSVQFR